MVCLVGSALVVIFPLMPKGVEHLAAGKSYSLLLSVIFPLMPKGVEHQEAGGTIGGQAARDFPSDAERR